MGNEATFIVYVHHNVPCDQWNPIDGVGRWDTGAYQQYEEYARGRVKGLSGMTRMATDSTSDIAILQFTRHPFLDLEANLQHLQAAPWTSHDLSLKPWFSGGHGMFLGYSATMPASYINVISPSYSFSKNNINVMANGSAVAQEGSGGGLHLYDPDLQDYYLVGELRTGQDSCNYFGPGLPGGPLGFGAISYAFDPAKGSDWLGMRRRSALQAMRVRRTGARNRTHATTTRATASFTTCGCVGR